jgi:hypothetical protein
LKRLPKLEYHGKIQPILCFQRSIFSIGARDTTAIVVSRSCRWAVLPYWSTRPALAQVSAAP